MSISESQLQTWSNQGATTSSQQTYASIQSALAAYAWPAGFRYEVYLQGSYRNSTNTRGNSDVDVVAELTSSFRYDVGALAPAQQQAFHSRYPPASHGWSEFRSHLEAALRSHYGPERVHPGKKCITVETPYLPADVLACQSYRGYDASYSPYPDAFTYGEGITFYVPAEGRWVVNFPKPHFQNGADKNGRVSGRYKPAVRCFKNARHHLVERGVIADGLAPSYFVECLVYNAPDYAFRGTMSDTFAGVISGLCAADMGRFVCQNGRVWLFGSSPEQWDLAKAQALLRALAAL